MPETRSQTRNATGIQTGIGIVPGSTTRTTTSSSSNLRQRRPSTAAETIAHAAKAIETQLETALLQLWDQVEPWRRDNAYILSGYRATSNSYLHSFRSLGYLHNESVNIWSHLVGAVGFAAAAWFLHSVVAPRYDTASHTDVLVWACFFAGVFLCLGMSATYHAISNHSPAVDKLGNKLDYSGIVFLIVGSYVPAIYYGFSCEPELLSIYLSLLCLLGMGCMTVSWFEHFRTPKWRPYRALMFVGLGLSGVVPVLHGMRLYGFTALNERMGLVWILLEGVMDIFGAFLYAACFPERVSPGTFDIWGSSHQIFHIFVVLAAASHLYGMAKAFDFHHSMLGAKCQ